MLDILLIYSCQSVRALKLLSAAQTHKANDLGRQLAIFQSQKREEASKPTRTAVNTASSSTNTVNTKTDTPGQTLLTGYPDYFVNQSMTNSAIDEVILKFSPEVSAVSNPAPVATTKPQDDSPYDLSYLTKAVEVKYPYAAVITDNIASENRYCQC